MGRTMAQSPTVALAKDIGGELAKSPLFTATKFTAGLPVKGVGLAKDKLDDLIRDLMFRKRMRFPFGIGYDLKQIPGGVAKRVGSAAKAVGRTPGVVAGAAKRKAQELLSNLRYHGRPWR
jgi:hypothetical protein